MLLNDGSKFTNAQKSKCDICFIECDLDKRGSVGRCGFYKNSGGKIVEPSKIMISEETEITAPMLGIYHAYQKERFAAIGSFSCNLKCMHCINFSYSYLEKGKNAFTEEELDIDKFGQYIECLKAKGCEGIVFSFSEWTIYGKIFSEIARKANKANLIVILCTNGMFNEESMNMFVDWIDVIRIDFKGLGDKGFQNLTGVDGYAHIESIFKKLKRLSSNNGKTWIEVSFCPVHGLNDNPIEIRNFARMVTDTDGIIPPMRLLRFIPSARTGSLKIGSDAVMDDCDRILREEGFPFVYKERDLDEDRFPTLCPICNGILFRRRPGFIEGTCACASCGADWTTYFHRSVHDALN